MKPICFTFSPDLTSSLAVAHPLVHAEDALFERWRDLLPRGSELLAATSKGVYVSTNVGPSWECRAQNSAIGGEVYALQEGGAQLLADIDRNLQYSTNSGRSWLRR